MAIIYHVTSATEWNNAKAKGEYVAPSLAIEGFIHCSHDRQVAGVLDRYYKGKADLVKLVIDTSLLEHELKEEFSLSVNDHFPHIFGPINVDAVVEVIAIS